MTRLKGLYRATDVVSINPPCSYERLWGDSNALEAHYWTYSSQGLGVVGRSSKLLLVPPYLPRKRWIPLHGVMREKARKAGEV
jgi:hypothetical protein